MFCVACKNHYHIENQSVACPHEPLARPETLDTYGWKMPQEIRYQIDEAYRNDDRDPVRSYLGNSNPLVHSYASQILVAFDLRDEQTKKLQEYSKNSQGNDYKAATWTEFWERSNYEREE